MNWRTDFLAPALRTIAAKAGIQTAFMREFLTGADTDERGGQAQLSQPFKRSAWVQRAIKNVVEPLSAVSLKFSADKRGGTAEIKDAAFLAFWNRPAVNMSLSEFVEASGAWMKLAGECFWLLPPSWTERRATSVREPVILARPDRMRHVVSGGQLVGWEYTDGAGRRWPLLPDELVHVKTFNPYDDFRGLSEFEAAKLAAQTDHAAGQFARNSMAASGDRGVYVIAKNGILDDKQREAIMLALREKQRMGQAGSSRPLFLSGDISVEDPKVTAPDADFVANRLENRHEVAIAFGIPASMFDVVASYSVGSASDRYRLIEDACMPLGGKLCDGFELLAQRFFFGRTDAIYAWFNWSEHSVVQAARRERLAALDGLWTKGVPLSLASEYLDLGLPRFAGDDISYLPFSVAPAAMVNEPPAPNPAPSDAPPAAAETPNDKIIRLLSAPRKMECAKSPNKAERDPRRVALAHQHEAARRPMEKAFAAKITKCLLPVRAQVLRRLEAAKTKGVEGKSGVAGDFNFDLHDLSGPLTVAMRNQAKAALAAGGAEMLEELGRDDVFAMAPHAALQYLTQRANRMADCAQEIHDRIGSQLQAGLDAGETMDELAERVRTAFNGIDRGRARTIAATETASAYGVARDAAMQQAGIQYKQWLTAGDDAVRDSHLECEGQTVALGEAFSNGLQFPGDPNGAPEEVINCRCVQIAVAGPNSEA